MCLKIKQYKPFFINNSFIVLTNILKITINAFKVKEQMLLLGNTKVNMTT